MPLAKSPLSAQVNDRMGNKLAAKREPRASSSSRFFRPSHKRRSEGLPSDCGTAVSTTDSQLPRSSYVSDKAGNMTLAPTEEEGSKLSTSSSQSADQILRIQEAEKILQEIANEYAAKRAAGLVPSKPVPARTLLWEEMERRAQRVRSGVGRRGTCAYGRDTVDGPCGCSTYKKLKLPEGRENAGGVCECCHHGAPWHRLTGGTMTGTGSTKSRAARSRSSSRNSHTAPQTAMESSLYSLGSDYYDEYDGEYSDEESEDDEEIANEVARPYSVINDPTPPLIQSHARSEGDALDRSSFFLNGDSFGLPPRLSSTSRHLDKLLNAIAKYRAMGLSEDEIEMKIRVDFPPTERLSYGAEDASQSTRSTRASH